MLRKLGVQARVNGASNVYISSGMSIWPDADEKKPAKKPVASICFMSTDQVFSSELPYLFQQFDPRKAFSECRLQ